MSNYEIKKTDFEEQKRELKTFAEQPATSTELDKFNEYGQWSDFWSGGLPGVLSGHNVTGEEMNSFVTKLQSCFAEINERDRKVIKEFGQVYETFEALDKGYIQGILIGVKSAEEASREAKDAQKDIDDTIKALQKTINKLKSFKDQINSYEHLKDVDQIWEDLSNAEEDINSISDKMDGLDKYVKSELETLNMFKAKIESQKHIGEIDDIWKRLKTAEGTISSSATELKDVAKLVKQGDEDLRKLKTTLEQVGHLADVDQMWKEIQEINARQSKWLQDIDQLSEKAAFIDEIQPIEHLKDIDVEWEYSHSVGKSVDELSLDLEKYEERISGYETRLQEAENAKKQIVQRLKTAYIIAGGALGLTVVQIVLLLTGVL